MAPFSLVTASVSWLARSCGLLSSSGSLARCTSVLPASYTNPGRSLTSQASGPPKRPHTAYIRYVVQEQLVLTKHNPGIRAVDIIRTIAQQWNAMEQELRQPFVEAFVRDMEQYKVDRQCYRDQLSPEQLQLQVLEMRERLAKRKAIRKRRELNNLGRPKRPRSPFNIFMSENFVNASGDNTPAKMMTLLEDWRNVLSQQKQVYMQLAEDDRIRYKNEIKSWEDHMKEIGRGDVIRERTLSADRKAIADAKKAMKSERTWKTAKSNVEKLVRTMNEMSSST